MEGKGQPGPRLRLLVVIASYGTKNVGLLKRVISRYQAMPFEVRVVIVSDAPKDLGPGIKVIAGLPTKDPWSLPFAHKAVLAENADKYDLFAYSEDDMEVREENIRAFLRVTPELGPDEIAGFLRYEVNGAGVRSMPDAHHFFRWKPESARRRGGMLVAQYSNEHAGFYLLTSGQLKKALASGGFMGAPRRRGRYGTPETAATDIYTCCGLRKVICVSELEDFLIHHASNRYAGTVGSTLIAFQEQVQALEEIADGVRVAKTLCQVEPKVLQDFFSKSLYEEQAPEWLEAVPKQARRILSIGCGWGAFEAQLQQRGATVTALGLDSVIGAVAERQGIQVIYGSLVESLEKMRGKEFDCAAMSDLIQLLPDPQGVIATCASVVRPGGSLLLSGPNFSKFTVRIKRLFLKGNYRKLRSYEESGAHVHGPSGIGKMLREAGFRVACVRWLKHGPLLGEGRWPATPMGFLTANEWMLEAKRV